MMRSKTKEKIEEVINKIIARMLREPIMELISTIIADFEYEITETDDNGNPTGQEYSIYSAEINVERGVITILLDPDNETEDMRKKLRTALENIENVLQEM